MEQDKRQQDKIEREKIANRPKHWVRLVTACNSRCVFCLDMDTPRNVFIPFEDICDELQKGIDKGADKVILSGGEAALHPRYVDVIRYAKSIGYDRVQTVTNGWKYADRKFYRDCIDAGLGEMTFSLHGNTAELHDRLTKHPGSFKRLVKSMVRAVRDPKGPIVNVDVVINKQNVAVLDKIIELCASLGVYEFDLLHVIPQSEAFRNRKMLFYDVREHMDVLHKVFRLNRHPRFVIWTNRFPVDYLEGLEDLIQDPHKMLDEINGRRFQVRRYLDTAEPLDCREPERCQYCFIEPFCTTMDRVIEDQNTKQFAVWDIGAERDVKKIFSPLPYGADYLGVLVDQPSDIIDLFDGHSVEVRCKRSGELPETNRNVRWVVETSKQLEQWIDSLLPNYQLEIQLNQDTESWIIDHQDVLAHHKDQISFHQPSYEKLEAATKNDIRNLPAFFSALKTAFPVSGLPVCIAKGMHVVPAIKRLPASIFDWESGRLDIQELARYHIIQGYHAKSTRCRDCKANDRCDGIHINMIRDQGLQLAKPLNGETWNETTKQQVFRLNPTPIQRLSNGTKIQKVAESLPSFPPPKPPPKDPLAILAEKKDQEQKEKRRLRKIRLGLPIEEE